GANGFLNLVSMNEGVQYRYEPTSDGASDSCQAIGLLCRMYLGWDKTHPAMIEGVQAIAARGPAKDDIYYNYYAAQVLRHYGGAEWEAFNRETREWLIASQVTDGHAAGSWHWPDS